MKGHSLPAVVEHKRGTSYDSEKKPANQGHSRTVQPRAEGQVRTAKTTKWARGTHVLSSKGGGSSQDSENKQVGQGHSRPVEQGRRDSHVSERKPESKGHSLSVERRRRNESGR